MNIRKLMLVKAKKEIHKRYMRNVHKKKEGSETDE